MHCCDVSASSEVQRFVKHLLRVYNQFSGGRRLLLYIRALLPRSSTFPASAWAPVSLPRHKCIL